jgi:hypothetical protein
VESNIVIAILAATLPVVASLITLWLSQRYSQTNAERERTHTAEQRRQDRLFEAREARYSDRRAAVVDLIAAASDETDTFATFELEHGYSLADVHEGYVFPKLNAAYARLIVLASPEVAEVADRLRTAVINCFTGGKDVWTNYDAALVEFQNSARTMLAEDTDSAATL